MLVTFTNQNHLFEKKYCFVLVFVTVILSMLREIDRISIHFYLHKWIIFFFPNYINLTAQECKENANYCMEKKGKRRRKWRFKEWSSHILLLPEDLRTIDPMLHSLVLSFWQVVTHNNVKKAFKIRTNSL